MRERALENKCEKGPRGFWLRGFAAGATTCFTSDRGTEAQHRGRGKAPPLPYSFWNPNEAVKEKTVPHAAAKRPRTNSTKRW